MVSDPALLPPSNGGIILSSSNTPDPDLRGNRYVYDSADELESSFQQRLDDYDECLKLSATEVDKYSEAQDELIQVITKFRIINRAFPNFYPEIVKLEAFKSMVDLLKVDRNCPEYLASYILLTFQELTDVDHETDGKYKAAAGFVNLLLDYGAIDVFVSTLGRFGDDDGGDGDDDDDDDNVDFRALQTIAQMMFINPDVARTVSKQTVLFEWVSEKLSKKDLCDNRKQYAVGFLFILLQSSTDSLELEKKSVKVVADALLPYTSGKEKLLLLVDEQYLLECLFRCLFLLLLRCENRELFAQVRGIDCMLNIIKQKNLTANYYGFAIKTLDMALKDCPSACDMFLDASGLDTAFPASMPSSNTHTKEEIDEYLVSILESLTGGITDDRRKKMLPSMFVANGKSIVERFKLCFDQVAAVNKEAATTRAGVSSDVSKKDSDCREPGVSSVELGGLSYLFKEESDSLAVL